MKTLIWDIENLPGLSYFWRAKTEYIGAHMVVHAPFMLSYAAKWQGHPKMYSAILTPAEVAARDDSRIVAELADLLRQSEKAVAHNGDRFDVPVLNSRILANDLPPLGPVQTIDTLKMARKSLSETHNSLGSLAHNLGVGNKIKTDFDLWRDCYFGDPKALRKMLRYNRMDVTVLEAVYEKLAPHVIGLPRLVDAEYDGQRVCPSCGADGMRRNGFHRTNAGTFPRLRCMSCGRSSRERKSDNSKRLGIVPLAS